MNKIPSVFLRNPENMQELTRELNPLCQWVIDGEGVPTRKYDGTCVMLDETGGWWARREVKPGKATPPEFKQLSVDDVTGKVMGYEPIENSSFYKIWQEAVVDFDDWPPGTYELCGPKINGNPEGYKVHQLIKHTEADPFTWTDEEGVTRDVIGSLTYNVIKSNILAVYEVRGWEGIVWHHPDGRMAKMKARDYKKEAA